MTTDGVVSLMSSTGCDDGHTAVMFKTLNLKGQKIHCRLVTLSLDTQRNIQAQQNPAEPSRSNNLVLIPTSPSTCQRGCKWHKPPSATEKSATWRILFVTPANEAPVQYQEEKGHCWGERSLLCTSTTCFISRLLDVPQRDLIKPCSRPVYTFC